jgi:hypothetical protein
MSREKKDERNRKDRERRMKKKGKGAGWYHLPLRREKGHWSSSYLKVFFANTVYSLHMVLVASSAVLRLQLLLHYDRPDVLILFFYLYIRD